MKMNQMIGWIGVGIILVAYIGVTFGILDPSDVGYGVLNGCGAIGIIVSSLVKRDFQPVVLNIVWLVVAMIGLGSNLLL